MTAYSARNVGKSKLPDKKRKRKRLKDVLIVDVCFQMTAAFVLSAENVWEQRHLM